MREDKVSSVAGGGAFTLLMVYLLMEYARPQSLIPLLKFLHLPAIVTLLLLFALIRSGKLNITDKYSKLFIILILMMTLHGPFATNNYWALMMWKAMVQHFIIFLSIYLFVDTYEKFIKMMNVWIAVHIFLAIIGLIKGGRGVGGFLEDENDLCMTINMIIPFTYFLAMAATNKKNRLLLFVLTGLFIFANIITYSRGGFIGLVAVGFYIWFRSPQKVLSTVLVSLLVFFVLIAAPAKYWDEVHSIFEEGTRRGSGEERIYTWKIGLAMFLDNPAFGVGQGNFPWNFREYEVETGFGEGLHTRSLAGREAHSLYVQLICELGMAGFLVFILMLRNLLRSIKHIRLFRNKGDPPDERQEEGEKIFYFSYALEGSLIGYLVSGIFISILYYPNFWILLGFAYSLDTIVSPSSRAEEIP